MARSRVWPHFWGPDQGYSSTPPHLPTFTSHLLPHPYLSFALEPWGLRREWTLALFLPKAQHFVN